MPLAKTVARNAQRDIYIVNGQLAMATGVDAYAQIIEAAIRTQKGELILDVDRGIPYMQTVFDRPHYIYLWEDAVKSRIRSFSFVKDIVAFETEIDYNARVLRYSAEISTDLGKVYLNNSGTTTS